MGYAAETWAPGRLALIKRGASMYATPRTRCVIDTGATAEEVGVEDDVLGGKPTSREGGRGAAGI